MALTKIGFTLIKDNFKDAVSGSSSEQSSSFSTRVTDLNLSLSGSTTLISGSAISTGSFGAANIAGMSVSNLVDFSSSIASRVTDEESDFTATGISGSWQGVIGSGSLGMVSGSAISTGSFGRVIVAEMGNSDLTDVSSSISTRVNLLEGSGSITESSASFSERVNLLEGSGSIFESSASFSERVNLLEGSGSINDLVTASGSFSTRVSDLKTDSGSFSTRVTTAEASGALFDGDGVVTFAGATITGTLTAQEVHTEFISASVTVSTGSNIFGDETGDVHQFTGSIETSGSIILDTLGGNVSGSVVSTGSFGAANIAGMTVSNLIDVSSSLSSRLTDVKTESGSFAAASSSYSSASGSFSTRVSDLKTDSGSFSTRVSDLNLSLSGSTSLISGSVTSTGSFGSVVAGGTGVNSFTGNVGIDTNNPLAPLHISKDVTQVSSSAESKTQAGLYLNFDPTAGSNSVTMFALSSSVATAGSYGIQVANSTGTGQYPFVINPYGGNVGIGTTTPPQPLTVAGNISGSSGLDIDGAVNFGGDLTLEQAGQAIVHINSSGDAAELKLTSSKGVWSIFSDNVSDNFLIHDGATRLAITGSTGYVGIGTSGPTELLHVEKSQNAYTRLRIKNANAGSSAQAQTNYVSDKGEFNVGITGDAHSLDGAAIHWNTANSNMIFATNNTQRMVVSASGEVGIGTSAPSSLLTVNGTATFAGTIASSNLSSMTQFDGDMDDLKKPGFYRIESGASNAPSATFWSCIVFGNGSNVTGQIVGHFQGTGNAYWRGFNSSWGSWRQIEN